MYGVEDEDLQDQFMDEDSPDDSDIPSAMVIHEALGVMVLDTQGMALSHCVSQAQRDQNGGLVADTMEEDVWAYNNGELWGNDPPQLQDNE